MQECAPELLELKRRILGELDALTPRETIIASSSSAITASAMAGELPGRERCLVVHPGNPPYLLPVVEIVPAPFTREDVVERASALLAGAGLSPVRVRVELEGFVFNRLQGAMLREAYALVRDGVASVEDIDRIVTDGLGRRYSVVGPFETSDLNVRGGIEAHARGWERPTRAWAPSAATTRAGRTSSSRRSRPSAARSCRSSSGTSASPGATGR